VRDELADGDRADRRLEVVGRDRAVVDLLHLHVANLGRISASGWSSASLPSSISIIAAIR
jgi:hypothetical protein